MGIWEIFLQNLGVLAIEKKGGFLKIDVHMVGRVPTPTGPIRPLFPLPLLTRASGGEESQGLPLLECN